MHNIKQHFVFTSGRSGSNYLANTLNQSPECVNYGEVLGEWTTSYKTIGRFTCNLDRYLNIVYKNRVFFEIAQLYSAYAHFKSGRAINYKQLKNIKSIGIKDFLVTMERQSAFDFVQRNPKIKVIYLYRDNLLKRYISGLLMKNTKVSATYDKVDFSPVNVNISDMLLDLDVLRGEAVRERKFISSLLEHDVFELKYEDYFNSESSLSSFNKQICEFLGVLPVEMTSMQKKILPDKLSEVVSNSDEVVQRLRDTYFEKWLY